MKQCSVTCTKIIADLIEAVQNFSHHNCVTCLVISAAVAATVLVIIMMCSIPKSAACWVSIFLILVGGFGEKGLCLLVCMFVLLFFLKHVYR